MWENWEFFLKITEMPYVAVSHTKSKDIIAVTLVCELLLNSMNYIQYVYCFLMPAVRSMKLAFSELMFHFYSLAILLPKTDAQYK